MALRAGYYGVKRFLRDKLETIAGTYDETIKILFPRSEQAVLGAKNKLKNELVTTTASDITYTVTDGIVNVSALTANKDLTVCMMYKKDLGNSENLILTGCPSGGGYGTYFLWWGIRNAANTNWIASGREEGAGVTINLKGVDYSYVKVEIEIKVSQDYTLPVEFKPMLRLATDTDPTYAPYAMTNKELTDSAAEQKTAINAIITAATGAADFAAFKTAMGAITPVTRSLLLTKEDITEEVKEDVEPKKTVTKKRTTKKTEEV